MLSFRNLSIFIQFEYILYSLICCFFGKNDIELDGGYVFNALEIELKNAYKHLLIRKKKVIERTTKYFMSLFSRYHLIKCMMLPYKFTLLKIQVRLGRFSNA